MKLSATAAVLALAASAQRVSATDFDFRDFEGLWETPDVQTNINSGALGGYGLSSFSVLTTFVCEATGDFRKAMCEVTSVTPANEGCVLGQQAIGDPNPFPLVPPGYDTAVQKCKFMLDQFDAETGKVGPLMCDLQCCGSDGCSDFPWTAAAIVYNTLANATLPEDALGPQMNVELTMLAGKNKNSVRAIEVVQKPMISDEGLTAVPVLTEFAYVFQSRKTAGGFKSVD